RAAVHPGAQGVHHHARGHLEQGAPHPHLRAERAVRVAPLPASSEAGPRSGSNRPPHHVHCSRLPFDSSRTTTTGLEDRQTTRPPQRTTGASAVRCGRAASLMPGILYVVATPIGNLEDITLRALSVLKEAALIACEDTRRTRVLLSHFGIHAPVTSYFEHNKVAKGQALLRTLAEGRSVALVTDAGTPGISDPGSLLVRAARDAGISVVPVPGAWAVIAALSAAGVPADRFVFEGFLPVKPGRRLHRLEALRALEMTIVCYESPHRIEATLEAIGQVFGETQIV